MAQANHTERDTNALWLGVFSPRELRWMVGLCAPALGYALVLKTQRVIERGATSDVIEIVRLFASDVSTTLLWLALGLAMHATVADGALRRGLRVVLQLGLVLYVSVLLGAQGYFMATGASLDYATLSFALAHLEDSRKVIASASTPGRWIGFGAAIAGVLVLPWIASATARACALAARQTDRILGATLTLSVAGMAAAVAKDTTFRGAIDLARDPFVHVLATASEESDEDEDPAIAALAAAYPRGPERLSKRAGGGAKNVVVILLESTSAWSTSLYGGKYPTTPFLSELAQKGLLFERAYSVVPHTSKAVVSSLCGIEPRPGVEMAEAFDDGIPGKCLATLLRDHGYTTAMMQAANSQFENRPKLIRNMGFDEFIPGETMPTNGYEKANYFGFEDRVMLEPTRAWLQKHAGKGPFFLAYLTNTPHHDYLGPKHYGIEKFTSDKVKNRYLNTVRYDDFFLRDLFAEFERAGVLSNTLFVIVGDHGDGFREHGLSGHDDILYDECLRVPLLVYDGAQGIEPKRVNGIFTQLDIAPTVLDALGFDVVEGSYVGRSMLKPLEPRTLYFACLTDKKCLGRIEGSLKLIHSFGRKPDELYDLAADPDEKQDLARSRGAEVKRAREDALTWYRTIRAMYRPALERAGSEFITDEPPSIQHPRKIRFGDAVEYLGWSMSHEPIQPGDWVTVTYYFHVLEPLPAGTKLFLYAEDAKRSYPWNHVPVHRMYPESRWRPGQYLADPHRIKVSSRWERSSVIVRGGFKGPRGTELRPVPSDGGDPILVEIPIRGRTAPAEDKVRAGSPPAPGRGK